MSLAEKYPTDAPVRTLHHVTTPAIDNILRLALNNASRGAPAEVPPASDRLDIDFSKAAHLLDRATSAITHLTARRDELEQAAAIREDYYGEKVQQLQDLATEWERRAKVIKAQLQDSETRFADQQVRLEALATRAEQAEARLKAVEGEAAEARRQLRFYHDKIVETFGSLG